MSPAARGGRKAERYAQLLDESRGGLHHHSRSPLDNGLSELIAIGVDLSDMGATVRANVGGPSEPWKRETRAFLIATIEREGVLTHRPSASIVPAPASTRPSRVRVRVRGAILIGLAAGTLALSGMSAASGSAMPGDTLYGIKRSQESAQLALASSNAAKGKLYLEFASTRLDEATAVHRSSDLLKSTVVEMDHETKLGISLLAGAALAHHDAIALNAITGFVTSQRSGIDTLLGMVGGDGSTRDEVLAEIPVLDKAMLRVAVLRTALACEHIAVVGSDEFGPRPAKSCQGAAAEAHGAPLASENAGTVAGAVAGSGNRAGSGGLLSETSHFLGGLLGH